MPQKDLEATITLPDGTQISLKGNKSSVSEVISSITKGRSSVEGLPPGGSSSSNAPSGATELAGIAEKGDQGKVHVVVNDLKAKTGLDAVRRLTYITLLSRRQLLSETKTPRKALVEVLRSYNLYDGNARACIAKDKGLVRDGRKTLALSHPAIPMAREFVKDIQDETKMGTWRPTSRSRRGRGKGKRRGVSSG